MKLFSKKDKVKKNNKKKKEIKDLNINSKPKKTKKEKASNFSLKEVIIIIVVTCLISSLCSGGVMFFKYKTRNAMSYYGVDNDVYLARFIEVYSDVLKNYYGDIDNEGMMNNAIKYMLAYLGDDYTSYLSKEEALKLQEKLDGKYEGIGIQMIGSLIYNVFDDSPASEVGLKSGDIIVEVNGEEITDENYNVISNYIKENDEVNIVVLRDEERLSFDVGKTTLDNPVVNYKAFQNGKNLTGYISIKSFSSALPKQMRSALDKLDDEGIDNLIIDLRGNTGGYLNAATEVSEMFLEKGAVLYSLEGKYINKTYKDSTNEKKDYDIVILVNGMTASSSEILACSLKDSYGATIVGNKTYGKGKTQTTKNFDDGTMAKYTTSKWFRPNGDSIDGVGIEPDYTLDLELSEEGDSIIDTQFAKAAELLSK